MRVSLVGLFCARLSVWFTICGDWVVSPPSVRKLFIQRKKGQPIHDNSQEWFKMKESWPQSWNLKTQAKLRKPVKYCLADFFRKRGSGAPPNGFPQKISFDKRVPPSAAKKGTLIVEQNGFCKTITSRHIQRTWLSMVNYICRDGASVNDNKIWKTRQTLLTFVTFLQLWRNS